MVDLGKCSEMHHLLIMEELGGNDRFFDRFLAQHIAFGYYAVVILLYLLNPVEAYNLNQDVEEHAFATYDEYIKENEEKLKSLPPVQAAIDYYVDGDMYMFDEFQTECELRRPNIENLYDVFEAIRDDEWAHVKTSKWWSFLPLTYFHSPHLNVWLYNPTTTLLFSGKASDWARC